MPLNKTVTDAVDFLNEELNSPWDKFYKIVRQILGTNYEHEQLKKIRANLEEFANKIELLSWLLPENEQKILLEKLQQKNILGNIPSQTGDTTIPSQNSELANALHLAQHARDTTIWSLIPVSLAVTATVATAFRDGIYQHTLAELWQCIHQVSEDQCVHQLDQERLDYTQHDYYLAWVKSSVAIAVIPILLRITTPYKEKQNAIKKLWCQYEDDIHSIMQEKQNYVLENLGTSITCFETHMQTLANNNNILLDTLREHHDKFKNLLQSADCSNEQEERIEQAYNNTKNQIITRMLVEFKEKVEQHLRLNGTFKKIFSWYENLTKSFINPLNNQHQLLLQDSVTAAATVCLNKISIKMNEINTRINELIPTAYDKNSIELIQENTTESRTNLRTIRSEIEDIRKIFEEMQLSNNPLDLEAIQTTFTEYYNSFKNELNVVINKIDSLDVTFDSLSHPASRSSQCLLL